ncbi:MAG TPA: LolA-related protein [Rhodanobacteraceae bacterium]|nr:LolA-related protein [Rhodanobacteraceae bacterium]
MRALRDALAALVLGVAMATTAFAAAPGFVDALLAGMARTPPASTPFVQVSYRGVLDRPLVVSGTLHWFGGDRMQRDIDKPFRETAKIGDGELSVQRGNGKVHRVSLARAPQAGAVLAGFRAMLGGDAAALRKEFMLSAQGDDTNWTMTLVPRTGQLKQKLVSIAVDGRGHEARCLVVQDANGDSSIMLVGAMAEQGLHSATPQEPVLVARCRGQ